MKNLIFQKYLLRAKLSHKTHSSIVTFITYLEHPLSNPTSYLLIEF